METLRVLAASDDWPDEPVSLWVRGRYRHALNCATREGRRMSLVLDEEDMGPRTLVVSELPDAPEGTSLCVAPPQTDRRLSLRIPLVREPVQVKALVREWTTFLDDDDLRIVGRVFADDGWTGILGLGPGCTPAGDDVLTGFLSALHARGMTPPRDVQEMLAGARRRTTWLAADIMRDALEGHTWMRGRNLLEAVASDSGERLVTEVRKVLDWGHSSGRAWLAGVALGFTIEEMHS